MIMKRLLLVLGFSLMVFPGLAQKKNILDSCNGDFKKEVQVLYDYAQRVCPSSAFDALQLFKSENPKWELVDRRSLSKPMRSTSNIFLVIVSGSSKGCTLIAEYSVLNHRSVCSALRSVLGEPYYSDVSDGRETAKWKTPGGLSVLVYVSNSYGIPSTTVLSFE